MAIKALNDRVILKLQPEVQEEKTAGGIIIPDQSRSQNYKGEVVSVGPGVQLDNGKFSDMGVKEGDLVYYSPIAGFPTKIDGIQYYVIGIKDLVAVIE